MKNSDSPKKRPGCVSVYALALLSMTFVCSFSSLQILMGENDQLMILFWGLAVGGGLIPSIVGIGLWKMKAWARGLLIMAHLLMILGLVTTWATKDHLPSDFKIQSVIIIIVNGITLYWFVTKNDLFE